ncbi:AAA family ATPase [Novosphingobium tardum]|uniref:AAA family ATPase n=1 Tax=Novosphingobium tardum TaxID=1538021 RepID=A0ABV8RUZ3_9SPHN
MFFDPPSLAEEQEKMRALLKYVEPRTQDDVRMVAAALKCSGDKYESVFADWAKPYGRFKAKQLWSKARPDPDALEEAAERQMLAEKRRNRFQPLSAAEICSMAPQEYRLKPILPTQGIAVVYGASGSGKSFVAMAMAGAIATGEPFFGYVTSFAHVLYVVLEGEAGIQSRVRAWQREYGREVPDDIRFLVQPFKLTDQADVSDLAAICPPKSVVFIDTLNRAAPGSDENSSKDMGLIIEGAKALQQATGGLVVLIAHTGKDPAKGIRGHSSLFAAIDAAILVSREGDARRWKIDKAKDGRDGDEHPFRLKVVEVGEDADGDAITSCVITPDASAVAHLKPLTGNRQVAMATLHEAASSNGALNEVGEFVGVPTGAWRAAFYRQRPNATEDANRKAFDRARGDLVGLGLVRVTNDLCQFDGPTAAATNGVVAAVLARQADKTGTLA